jgi:hypothetical protein
MDAPVDREIPELSENDREYEIAYSELMERRKTRDQKFKEAEEFHRERKKKAEERKAKKNNPQLRAEREKMAADTEREFDEKLQAYRTAMEQFIPYGDSNFDLSPLTEGAEIHVHHLSEDITGRKDTLEPSNPRTGHSIKVHLPPSALPATTRHLPIEDKPEESKEATAKTLPPIPVPHDTVKDSKPETIASASAPPSIRTGAQIRVIRVPTERIPSSLGLSEYGIHPHATIWTRAPTWAQVSVALGMGAVFGGAGFGIYRLFGKIFKRRSKVDMRRLHARDWDIKI